MRDTMWPDILQSKWVPPLRIELSFSVPSNFTFYNSFFKKCSGLCVVS